MSGRKSKRPWIGDEICQLSIKRDSTHRRYKGIDDDTPLDELMRFRDDIVDRSNGARNSFLRGKIYYVLHGGKYF